MMENRKPGFYWIKEGPDKPWIIAEWVVITPLKKRRYGNHWLITGLEDAVYDKDFFLINENRIKNPDE